MYVIIRDMTHVCHERRLVLNPNTHLSVGTQLSGNICLWHTDFPKNWRKTQKSLGPRHWDLDDFLRYNV